MALTKRQEAKLEQMRKGKGGFDFGNQGKRAPQYYGGKNGYRKLGTLQNLLTSGDISSINKKEWGRLKDLESGKLAVGANGQAIKPTTTGVTSGPASTTKGVPGNASMRDAGVINYEKGLRQQAMDRIAANYNTDLAGIKADYTTARAEGADQFSEQVREDGIDAAAAGVGLNPAIAGARYMDSKKDFAEFAAKLGAKKQESIDDLNRRRTQAEEDAEQRTLSNIWDYFLRTRTSL